MKFALKIDMDNAAFADGCNGSEVARILKAVVVQTNFGGLSSGDGADLRDYNGNKVGEWKVYGK